VLGSRGKEGVAREDQRRHLRHTHIVNYFTEMCSGSEAGSFLRLIDFCITQL